MIQIRGMTSETLEDNIVKYGTKDVIALGPTDRAEYGAALQKIGVEAHSVQKGKGVEVEYDGKTSNLTVVPGKDGYLSIPGCARDPLGLENRMDVMVALYKTEENKPGLRVSKKE